MGRFQQQFWALGSNVVMTIVCLDEKEKIEQIFNDTYRQVQAFEARFSRFKPDSELSLVNQKAGEKISITPLMREILIASKEMARLTDNLFNPFVLPLLQKAGYVGSFQEQDKPEKSIDYRSRIKAEPEKIELGDDWVRIPRDTALDLGGIGKGFLLDHIGGKLDKYELEGYWLSLGGDILCAGNDLNTKGWGITVASAYTQDQAVGLVETGGSKMAVATSGTLKRHGISDGITWHHIIDPNSEKPATTDVVSATVSASSGVIADVIAKCMVVGGEEKAKYYLKSGIVDSYLLQFSGPDNNVLKKGKVV